MIQIKLPNGKIILIPIHVPHFNFGFPLGSGFYDLKARIPVTTSLTTLACEPQADLSDLPFANGELLNSSFGGGCSYRFRLNSLAGWRATARYRFSKQKLVVTNTPDRYYVDHGLQAELSKEYSLPAGFVRAAPWIDVSHSHVAPSSLRIGENLRAYREWTPRKSATILTDVTASAGTSIGPLSTNRSFTGGNPFDPTLLEHSLRTEDYIWMGPTLRGYGFSEFRAPQPPTILTREGSSFAGISMTLGLPGWSSLLFDDKPLEDRQQLKALVDNLTAITRARALEDYLKTESSPEKARAFAQKRVNDTKAMLQNILQHTKQFSLRPLVVYDYGAVMSRDSATVNDWSAGVGFRMWFRLGLVETLYARNGGAIPGASRYNLTIRFRLRGSPEQPYPF